MSGLLDSSAAVFAIVSSPAGERLLVCLIDLHPTFPPIVQDGLERGLISMNPQNHEILYVGLRDRYRPKMT